MVILPWLHGNDELKLEKVSEREYNGTNFRQTLGLTNVSERTSSGKVECEEGETQITRQTRSTVLMRITFQG